MIFFRLKNIYDYSQEFSPTRKLFLKMQKNNALQINNSKSFFKQFLKDSLREKIF